MSWTEAERRQKRREYQRLYRAEGSSRGRTTSNRIIIPDVLERREFHEPCFRCGSNGECKHRVADVPCGQSLTGCAAGMMVAM